MNYATVCSGIGAPEVAWRELWGEPVFVSEIEPFPSAVLKHHMPDVPNYGDMTKYKEWPDHELDVLIGGTPCQSFSVAGLRRSLEDDRGNLALTFLRLAGRYKSRFTIWENVPGVLNTSDNAFGCFLGGLVGADKIPVPNSGQGQGWGNSGVIYGPERLAAWRVLDAQYFGVPQRRRRVFVIASPRKMGFAPCQILFEPESLHGNIKTRKETGQEAACYTPSSIGSYSEGCGTLRSEGGDCGGGSETIIAKPLLSHGGPQGRYNPTDENYVVFAGGQGAKASMPISDKVCSTLKGQAGENAIPCVFENHLPGAQAVAFGQPVDTTGFQGDRCVGNGDVFPALSAQGGNNGGGLGALLNTNSIVRRLTPIECERLQGFPDGYTLIPYRGKAAADGPRYKALGNSMAVPVLKWIGRRIQIWEDINK